MTLRQLFKKSAVRWWRADPGSLGAALSFYVFFSLTPLLSFGLIIFGKIIPKSILEEHIVATSYTFAGEGVASLFQDLLEHTHNISSNIVVGSIGLAILIFGSMGVFNQLQSSLDRIWGIPREAGVIAFVRQKTFAFVIFVVLGIIIVLSFFATITLSLMLKLVLSYVGSAGLVMWIPVGQIITFVAIVLIIVSIYHFMTKVTLDARARWMGGIGTAMFFMAGDYLLRLYLTSYSFSSSYGALGTLAVLLIWVYYSAQIFFYGAAWTYTLDEALRYHEEVALDVTQKEV